MPVRPQCDRPGRPAHPRRRGRGRRGRRHGVDVRGPVCRPESALRRPPGQHRDDRFDGARRPVVDLHQAAHGRELGRGEPRARDRARGTGRVGGAVASASASCLGEWRARRRGRCSDHAGAARRNCDGRGRRGHPVGGGGRDHVYANAPAGRGPSGRQRRGRRAGASDRRERCAPRADTGARAQAARCEGRRCRFVRRRRPGRCADHQPRLKKAAPFGSWSSPISIDLLLKGEMRLAGARWDGADLYWIEGRPDEDGRQVIVRRSADGAIADITPRGFNARTRVHEYGGGDYAVSGGAVWFTNFDDQRLYRQDPGGVPRPVGPAGDVRHADLTVDAPRRRIVAVREDHSSADQEPVNTLVSLDVNGGRDAIVLASGNDFYSSPKLSPDGRRLAWLTWNHPNMPWDGTELWVGELASDGAISSSTKVAGGSSESICQPEWGPAGELDFIADRTGWWNLYCVRGHRDEALCNAEEEFGGPQWVFGRSHYAVLGENEIVCLHSKSNVHKLSRLDLRTGVLSPVKLLYSFLDGVRVSGRKAVMFAASPTHSLRVLTVDLDTGAEEVVRATVTTHIDPNHFSIPRPIEFATEGGLTR